MNDLKYALRALMKSPIFAVIAVVTLALGIGLNTAMFSLTDTMFLRPLPFEDASSLVRVYRATAREPNGDLPAADFLDLRSAEAAFGQFAGSIDNPVALSDPGLPAVRADALHVSSNYLDVLRVRPEIGRSFTPADDTGSSAKVAVISHALWVRRYGADPDILGKTLRIDGDPHEVIGVLPESADDGRVIRETDVFEPLRLSPLERASRNYPWLKTIGRRDAHVPEGQGKASVTAIGARVARANPKEDGDATWRAESLGVSTGNPIGKILTAMFLGLSSCVLLIACSNLANFTLARTIERSQELSVRSALGASLFHLIRPLAMESLLLAGVGGFGAVLVDLWSSRWLSAQSVASGGNAMHFPLDARVLTVAIGTSVATALVFGAGPAFLIARINVNETLKHGSRGATTGVRHKRLRSLLIVGQFAMAMTLLGGAAFLVRGASVMLRQHLGWDASNVVGGSIDLPKTRYDSPGKILAFQRTLVTRLRGLAGVQSAAIAYGLPYSGSVGDLPFIAEGRPRPARGEEPSASRNAVSPDYFQVTGGRIAEGRSFTESENATAAHVVIINETMAHALFPNDDPIGRRIARADQDKADWCQIVGIAADARPTSIYGKYSPYQIYYPVSAEPWQFTMFAVRTEPGAQKAVLASVESAVASIDPYLPVIRLNTGDGLVALNSFELGMLKKMLGTFALLGLGLAALGIYGVIARTVVQRTPEIGIRMALGATARDVSRLVLGSGLRLALAGCALGLAGAFGITLLLGKVMQGVQVNPGAVVAEAAGILVIVAIAACYLPARAASKVDPVSAIRAE
jgi:putative ABC transport system permease protein